MGEERHLPYDRPPLSKQVLAGTWPPEKAVLADKRRSSELRVHEVLGRRAVGLDAAGLKVELDDGAVLEGDAVVITTGAAPRRLPGTESLGQRDGLFTLRTLDDSVALRAAVTAKEAARVVVIGAGFIGAEVASTCTDLGCRVTVLEALDIPLRPVLGPMLGEYCASLHRSHGVDLRLGVSVAGVRRATAADGGAGSPPASVAGARRRSRGRRVGARRRRRGRDRRDAPDGMVGRVGTDGRQRGGVRRPTLRGRRDRRRR